MESIIQNNTIELIRQFKTDVDLGLSAAAKYIPSKYFYDNTGDAIFVEIMNMPEYYLTKAELDIFTNKTKQLVDSLQLNKTIPFDVIELGAGNGLKTKALLKYLKNKGYNFSFLPVDISQNALNNLERTINKELPNVEVKTKRGDYFKVLKDIKLYHKPKVILFLGSNIGNLTDTEAQSFLKELNHSIEQNDKIVLGTDLIKSSSIILPAYNDAKGITARFNLNVLQRINKELDANFNISKFIHKPIYNEKEGVALSFLESTEHQTVYIKATNTTYNFYKGERIYTETSRKYNDTIVTKILGDTNLKVIDKLTDCNNYFADYILTKY